jgi:hypothetical protein
LVNYGGRFDRQDKCIYVIGKIGVLDETYDLDCLLFIEIERIVKKYGYQPGGLIYYLQPDKSYGMCSIPDFRSIIVEILIR